MVLGHCVCPSILQILHPFSISVFPHTSLSTHKTYNGCCFSVGKKKKPSFVAAADILWYNMAGSKEEPALCTESDPVSPLFGTVFFFQVNVIVSPCESSRSHTAVETERPEELIRGISCKCATPAPSCSEKRLNINAKRPSLRNRKLNNSWLPLLLSQGGVIVSSDLVLQNDFMKAVFPSVF